MQRNYFPTLNDALDAENLLPAWACTNPPIQYGETRAWTHDDGSRYGRHISIYRDERGMYERPVHYAR